MKYLESYNDYVHEGIVSKIKKLFNGKGKNKKLKEILIKILTEYKNRFLNKTVTKAEIGEKIEYLRNELGDSIVYGLNLDNFIRGIYNISIKQKNKEKKLEKYFNDYILDLDTRIDNMINWENYDSEFDPEFDELKKLKKERTIKIGAKQFLIEKESLQIELLKMLEWVKTTGSRVILVFEGRDAAGKGSAIKTITEYLDPKYFKVATFGIPTKEEQNDWFMRYEKELPKKGHITFFDRSWYNRAVNDPVMGYCTEEEYMKFMTDVIPFENNLIDKGYILMKFWFSIEKDTQELRFKLRQINPLKYWKYSPNDEKTIPKWDLFTKFKEQMLQNTSTDKSPWVIVDSNDKRTAKLNVMRYILNKIPYSKIKQHVYPEVVFEI
jgi:polyphosphate kinase 2